MSQTRVLVIGVGSIGERHVRCFQATGRTLVSICEMNDDLRTTIADRYDVDASYSSLDDVEDTFDCAVVCTPAHLHVPMTMQLLARGKHVLIEKPLSVTLDGIDEMLSAANGKVTGVAYVMRMHPTLRATREVIASGRFGKPVQLVYKGGQHFPFYRPAYRDIYYADRSRGGGAIQDAMTHVMNTGEWLLGPLTRLTADAAHQVLPDVDVEDTVHVIGRHRDVMASYSLNQHQAVNDASFTIACEEGVVRAEPLRHRWLWQTEPNGDWQAETQPTLGRDELFIAQAEMFLDAIAKKGKVACTLAEALQTLRVNLAIMEAAGNSTWVNVAQACNLSP